MRPGEGGRHGVAQVLRVALARLPVAADRVLHILHLLRRGARADCDRCYRRFHWSRCARLLAVVPQEIARDIPYTAHDFVLLGRTASLPRFGGPDAQDFAAVQEAMTSTETWSLRQRPLPEMSGGERQRLALAMALAARPEIILLDEPTSHLDLRHRAEMMSLLTRLNREHQLTVLMVVHDLTLASQFFPRLVLLSEGRKLADGTPAEVLKPDLLEAAYTCAVSVIPLPEASALCVLPRI